MYTELFFIKLRLSDSITLNYPPLLSYSSTLSIKPCFSHMIYLQCHLIRVISIYINFYSSPAHRPIVKAKEEFLIKLDFSTALGFYEYFDLLYFSIVSLLNLAILHY